MVEPGSHYLYPGTIFTATKPININTILGSCISVCLWDPKLSYGGMNHFMLPFWNGNGLATPKYGNIAIEKLIGKMENSGSKLSDLKAKVFGGGKVIQFESDLFNIGERNIALAVDLLREYKIPIIAKSIGGTNGRKIIFNTFTGEVGLRFVNGMKRK